jgi:hypothetical protein
MEEVTFAGLRLQLRHTDFFVRRVLQMSSHQIVECLRACSCRYGPTQSLTSRPSNTIPSPGCELRGGFQEAGFREMIDEGVSSVSKSYFPL